MNIKFKNLALTCRQQADKEIINFSPQLSLFYGKMSSGKSTIAHLIDYCLGGELERLTALTSQLVSVELYATIGKYDVIFERKAFGCNQIQVTWTDLEGAYASVLAPTQASSTPIWGDNVFSISDLIFFLSGRNPLKVPKNKDIENTVRLSFRDIMWYCYLEQDHLDSSFYWLDYPFKAGKSRYVLEYTIGAYNEKIDDLQNQLANTKILMKQREDEVANLTSFLKQFGYNSEDEILEELFLEDQKLMAAKKEIVLLKQGHRKDTHFADKLRSDLRELESKLATEEKGLIESRERSAEQISLKAELIQTKFKLVRSKSASNILASVEFDFCPLCGTRVLALESIDECPLCKQNPSEVANIELPNEDVVKLDLDSRIFELDDSIKRLTEWQLKQAEYIKNLKLEKEKLDNKFAETTRDYDSTFVAQSREVERQLASSIERISSLNGILRMPQAVAKMKKEIEDLVLKLHELEEQVKLEKEKITTSEQLIKEIENSYLDCLKAIKLPGINPDDQVEINRTTWVPYILPHGSLEGKWDFFNAGSGGKRTLLNVAYALSIHKVAAMYNLPLPNFLIIDSPMKNIGKEVNKEIFEAFYRYLYDLAQGPLLGTQFIIIETDFVPQPPDSLDKIIRLMTPDDAVNPPLIPYYRGP